MAKRWVFPGVSRSQWSAIMKRHTRAIRGKRTRAKLSAALRAAHAERKRKHGGGKKRGKRRKARGRRRGRRASCRRGVLRRRRCRAAYGLARWRKKHALKFGGLHGRGAAGRAARYLALCSRSGVKTHCKRRRRRRNMPYILRNIPYVLRNRRRHRKGGRKRRRNFGIESIKARAGSVLRNWKSNILWLGVGMAAPKLLGTVGSKLPVVGPVLASISSGIPGVLTVAGLGIIASELAHRYVGFNAGQMVELGAGVALLSSILSLSFIPGASMAKGLIGMADHVEFSPRRYRGMSDFVPLSDFPEVAATAPENWLVNTGGAGQSTADALYESTAIYGDNGGSTCPAPGAGSMADFLEFAV